MRFLFFCIEQTFAELSPQFQKLVRGSFRQYESLSMLSRTAILQFSIKIYAHPYIRVTNWIGNYFRKKHNLKSLLKSFRQYELNPVINFFLPIFWFYKLTSSQELSRLPQQLEHQKILVKKTRKKNFQLKKSSNKREWVWLFLEESAHGAPLQQHQQQQ